MVPRMLGTVAEVLGYWSYVEAYVCASAYTKISYEAIVCDVTA